MNRSVTFATGAILSDRLGLAFWGLARATLGLRERPRVVFMLISHYEHGGRRSGGLMARLSARDSRWRERHLALHMKTLTTVSTT